MTPGTAAGRAHRLLEETAAALDLPSRASERVAFTGSGSWRSCFPVTDLAVAALGSAALAVSELVAATTGEAPAVALDRRLASLWFAGSILPQGWDLPSPWEALAGDYPTADGWIKLHTNAPRHRMAALAVLACAPTREAVAAAVRSREGEALEQAVVDAGGAAARLRSRAEWLDHPQGRAVAAEPLVIRETSGGPLPSWRPAPGRPLAGLRVLDLTRVLAGPVATRFLAGYGAEVLRIDPPGWDEPAVAPDVTLGKRCARLDLREAGARARFETLLARADILVHGYRPGALDGLGFGAAARRALRPGLIEVSLDAYGHSGPWAGRRGFDSLVQFSCGIAARGMGWQAAARPVSLPVQALDHATGYLLAAASVRAVLAALRDGTRTRARLSLARTAELLWAHLGEAEGPEPGPIAESDLQPTPEPTHWGPGRRLRAPVEVAGAAMGWTVPAGPLGASEAAWQDGAGVPSL